MLMNNVSGQTFSSVSGGSIPDNGFNFSTFLINVTGLSPLTTSNGLTQVKLNINHTYVGDLEIYLESPNGIRNALSTFSGGDGHNYTNTVFTLNATNSIANAVSSIAPFTGNYLPTSSFGVQNNGQNPNGNWKLLIRDYNDGPSTNSNGGTLLNWQLTFGSSAPPAPPTQPACSSLSTAGLTCSTATSVCSFNGYCGNTNLSNGAHTWLDLDLAFCGGIQNNSFVKFVASANTASFNVWVYNSSLTTSTVTKGLQMMFFSTNNCGSGSVNNLACYHNIPPGNYPSIIQASGLIIGNTYYLMFDGYGGDQCDYTITPISGVQTVAITGTTSNGTTSNNICLGESITLTPSGLSGPFTWTGGDLPVGGIVSPSITVSPTATTTYTVSSPDPTNSCAVAGTINSSFTVTVSALPATPTISSSAIRLCNGQTSPNLASYITSPGPFLWYVDAYASGAGQTSTPVINTNVTAHHQTQYYVTQASASCGESAPVMITVDIFPNPAAPDFIDDFSTCSSTLPVNGTISVNNSNGTNVNWYSLSTSGTLLSTTPSNSLNISLTSFFSPQYFYAEAVDPISTCVSETRTQVTATVNENPYVTTPVINAVQCSPTEPEIMNLSVTTNNSDNLIYWYSVPIGGSTLSSALTYSPSISFGTKDFYVEVKDPGTNCISSSRTHITATLNRNPDLPVLTDNFTDCRTVPGNVVLSASSSIPAHEILWYDSPTATSIVANGDNYSYTVPSFGTSMIYVEVKDPATGCVSSPRSSTTVTINKTPDAPVLNPISSCTKSVSISSSTTLSSDETISWYNNNYQLLSSANPYNITFQTPGNYIIYADISNNSTGCKSSSTPVNIEIKHALNLGTDLTKTICQGSDIDFNTIYPSSFYNSTIWTSGGNTVSDIHHVNQPGIYQLDATNTEGCRDQVLVTIRFADPVQAFAGNDTIAVVGQPHQLNGYGGYTYEWSSTSVSSPFTSFLQKPMITIYHDQMFILKVTDINGCIGRDSVFIKALSGPEYHTPNAFTPNGDGLNDIFRVVPAGIAYTQWFKIFNRNGNLVFQTNKWMFGWDGRYQGKMQPSGTYVWVIKGIDKYGNPIERKGTVLLIQ